MSAIRPIAILTVLLCAAFSAVAAETGKKIKLQGYLVDIACSVNDKEDPDYMRNKHTKGCFQMPACEKSGYALLTKDDKVIRFDAAGNALAVKLIHSAQKDKDWRIVVRGRLLGEQLTVTRLELQK